MGEFRAFEADIVPVQIRPDLVVYIQGLPWNLTKDEAEKVAAVVEAMATASPDTASVVSEDQHQDQSSPRLDGP